MNRNVPFYRIKKSGIIYTIILIGVVVIGLSYAVYHFFDYRINDTMIATMIAAFSLIYEINKSKKLNEAEFLIHLNSMFITNPDYKTVYNLLSTYNFEDEPNFEKEITNCDISNYLTLFETFYILLKRKVIDIALLDDLFAYRFFLAVHNPYIQRKKLCVSPKNFKNIFRLEHIWLQYRKENNITDNYFSESYHLINRTDPKLYYKVFNKKAQKEIDKMIHVPPFPEENHYTFTQVTGKKAYDRIHALQHDAVIESDNYHQGMLRANTDSMLRSCLKDPHVTVAVTQEDTIVAFGVLYDPSVDEKESIKKELDLSKEKEIAAIDDKDIMHIKLVVVDPKHRGHKLQYHLTKELEQIAVKRNKKLLLTTVSPYNVPSVKNTVRAGFTYKRTVKKYAGATRLIYAKMINES